MKTSQRLVFWITVLLGVALALHQTAEARPSFIPPRPPRPTPEVPPPPPPIAMIELRTPAAAGLWATVQWQNTSGQWIDVTGWDGPLGVSGVQQWSVEQKDFGAGPFRWRVYEQSGGKVWGTSAQFQMPTVGGQTITVSLEADPSPWAFILQSGVELRTNPAGCGRYTIAGKVVGSQGQAMPDYRIRLTHPDGDKEIIVAGGAPAYGPAGYGFILGKRRAGRPYVLQLLSRDGAQAVAAPVKIVFSGDCDKNLAWVVFQVNSR
jgi:hypothetical protein